MRRLTVFNQLSLDGYFVDSHGDMSWAHKDDAEWRAFVAENSADGGALLALGDARDDRGGLAGPVLDCLRRHVRPPRRAWRC